MCVCEKMVCVCVCVKKLHVCVCVWWEGRVLIKRQNNSERGLDDRLEEMKGVDISGKLENYLPELLIPVQLL